MGSGNCPSHYNWHGLALRPSPVHPTERPDHTLNLPMAKARGRFRTRERKAEKGPRPPPPPPHEWRNSRMSVWGDELISMRLAYRPRAIFRQASSRASTSSSSSPSTLCTRDFWRTVILWPRKTEGYFRPVAGKEGCWGDRTKSEGRGSAGMTEEMKSSRISSARERKGSGVRTTAGRTLAEERSVKGYRTRTTLPRFRRPGAMSPLRRPPMSSRLPGNRPAS